MIARRQLKPVCRRQFLTRQRLVFLLGCWALGVSTAEVNWGRAPGVTAGPNASLLKNGKPFRAIGVNYFDCFLRVLKRPDDTTYDGGFATLARKGLPFARFCATGFWPQDMRLYQTNRAEYFHRLDGVIQSAERHGVGLVPSLFWNYSCVPDLAGEPLDQWANPQSKTRAWMREYVREVVVRYRDNPAIWAWEFGNEYSRQADLPNAKEHRPAVHPALGTPAMRTPRDALTGEMVCAAFAAFASEVRQYDPHRLIVTGDSFPRVSAWHQQHENRWTPDTPVQFAEMLAEMNPDPVTGISLHVYEAGDEQRLTQAMLVSRKLNKPVFVGEFGAPGGTPAAAAKFRRLLKSIVDHEIPLAALWVFDFAGQKVAGQKDYNVTADNARSWQLELVAAANRNLRPAAAVELKPR